MTCSVILYRVDIKTWDTIKILIDDFSLGESFGSSSFFALKDDSGPFDKFTCCGHFFGCSVRPIPFHAICLHDSINAHQINWKPKYLCAVSTKQFNNKTSKTIVCSIHFGHLKPENLIKSTDILPLYECCVASSGQFMS